MYVIWWWPERGRGALLWLRLLGGWRTNADGPAAGLPHDDDAYLYEPMFWSLAAVLARGGGVSDDGGKARPRCHCVIA